MSWCVSWTHLGRVLLDHPDTSASPCSKLQTETSNFGKRNSKPLTKTLPQEARHMGHLVSVCKDLVQMITQVLLWHDLWCKIRLTSIGNYSGEQTFCSSNTKHWVKKCCKTFWIWIDRWQCPCRHIVCQWPGFLPPHRHPPWWSACATTVPRYIDPKTKFGTTSRWTCGSNV